MFKKTFILLILFSITIFSSVIIDTFDTESFADGSINSSMWTFEASDKIATGTLRLTNQNIIGDQGISVYYSIGYTIDTAWAGVTWKTADLTIVDTSLTVLSFFLKGDGTSNSFYVYFYESDGDAWYKLVSITGKDWQNIKLSLTDFLDPNWDADSEGDILQVDLSKVNRMGFQLQNPGSVIGAEGTIYLDDFILMNSSADTPIISNYSILYNNGMLQASFDYTIQNGFDSRYFIICINDSTYKYIDNMSYITDNTTNIEISLPVVLEDDKINNIKFLIGSSSQNWVSYSTIISSRMSAIVDTFDNEVLASGSDTTSNFLLESEDDNRQGTVVVVTNNISGTQAVGFDYVLKPVWSSLKWYTNNISNVIQGDTKFTNIQFYFKGNGTSDILYVYTYETDGDVWYYQLSLEKSVWQKVIISLKDFNDPDWDVDPAGDMKTMDLSKLNQLAFVFTSPNGNSTPEKIAAIDDILFTVDGFNDIGPKIKNINISYLNVGTLQTEIQYSGFESFNPYYFRLIVNDTYFNYNENTMSYNESYISCNIPIDLEDGDAIDITVCLGDKNLNWDIQTKNYIVGNYSVDNLISGFSLNNNPFTPNNDGKNDNAVFEFKTLKDNLTVTFKIVDEYNRLVKPLLNGEQISRGTNKVTWNGTDYYNEIVSSGFYIYSLEITDENSGTSSSNILGNKVTKKGIICVFK